MPKRLFEGELDLEGRAKKNEKGRRIKTVKTAPRECQTEPATDRKRECGESGLEN